MPAVLQFRPVARPEPAAVEASRREVQLSRLLMFWISLGLAFMLLPGTFLGVWNLISISNRRAAEAVSPTWIQAHGHAQIFGWIGSFILGIGFYSLPKLLRGKPFSLWRAWMCAGLWATGVGLRWSTNVYAWHWRVMLPLSAILEAAAFLVFFQAVAGHRPEDESDGKMEPWVWVVVAGTCGLLLALVVNLTACIYLAERGVSPAFPSAFDQRYLVLITWGFLVPFVWGFSARWLPVFLGVKSLRKRALLAAVLLNTSGVAAALAGKMLGATLLLLFGAAAALHGIRIFTSATRPPKVRGVHSTFPLFVRSAYAWLLIASALGVWAADSADAAGLWGASRHALTVGFFSMMVFGIGQRILPAFSGMRHLFCPRLMFASMLLLTVGCALRVSSEALAYQGIVHSAWSWLPVSAMIELTAVTLFAVNLWITFSRPAPPVLCA